MPKVYNRATGEHQKPAPQYDGPSTSEIIKEAIFGGAPRPLKERKGDIDKAVDQMTSLKSKQDKSAGIKRRV